MATSTPPAPPPTRRPPGAGIGIPTVREVHAPGWIARRPTWLVASVVLLVLLLISAFLRSRQISGELWFNEAIAIGTATRSFGGVLHAARDGGSAPLYYLLLHFWVNGFGDGETAVRALSLLFALLTIPVAGWAGWTLVPRGAPANHRAALYAALLFAFAAALTTYSPQAQPYTLLVLLALLATVGFLQGFVLGRRRHLWLLVVALEAALYTQGSAVLLVVGMIAGLGIVIRCAPDGAARRQLVRDGLICLAALVVLYLPWLPATIHQIAHATSPWHYTPLIGADVPEGIVGGERIDAAFAVVIVLGLAPLLLVRSRRRGPEAVTLWSLVLIAVAGFVLAALLGIGAPVWATRYLVVLAPALLLLAALCSARARIMGLVAILLCVVFCADPAQFAPGHMSDMREVSSELSPAMHPGDLVVVAQPEQTPLAAYYLPAGLRFASTLGAVSQPSVMNWDGALSRLQATSPRATLVPLVASLKAGQHLLFIRPLTEGARNWKSPWAALVRRRAAQWGQVLTEDVARGILIPMGTAPDNYPGDCCVADSAVLYRKAH